MKQKKSHDLDREVRVEVPAKNVEACHDLGFEVRLEMKQKNRKSPAFSQTMDCANPEDSSDWKSCKITQKGYDLSHQFRLKVPAKNKKKVMTSVCVNPETGRYDLNRQFSFDVSEKKAKQTL